MWTFLTSRAGLYLVGAIALAGILAHSHWTAYSLGREIEQKRFLEQIKKENDDAGEQAERWRADYRRCVDGGGVYEFETGACIH